mmetsp:Transcript_42535/g.100956  ORF Transcript_42535/g.100956 Transcript_42535/m.100956 type:complete len:389 (+) Transcript_42535:2825-3991(+)
MRRGVALFAAIAELVEDSLPVGPDPLPPLPWARLWPELSPSLTFRAPIAVELSVLSFPESHAPKDVRPLLRRVEHRNALSFLQRVAVLLARTACPGQGSFSPDDRPGELLQASRGARFEPSLGGLFGGAVLAGPCPGNRRWLRLLGPRREPPLLWLPGFLRLRGRGWLGPRAWPLVLRLCPPGRLLEPCLRLRHWLSHSYLPRRRGRRLTGSCGLRSRRGLLCPRGLGRLSRSPPRPPRHRAVFLRLLRWTPPRRRFWLVGLCVVDALLGVHDGAPERRCRLCGLPVVCSVAQVGGLALELERIPQGKLPLLHDGVAGVVVELGVGVRPHGAAPGGRDHLHVLVCAVGLPRLLNDHRRVLLHLLLLLPLELVGAPPDAVRGEQRLPLL